MNITIRTATPEDLTVIHQMADLVFRDTYKQILSPDQMEYMMDWMYSLESLRKQLEEGHVYYLAEVDGQPQGYLSVQPEGSDEECIPVFHLQKIYVLPGNQGTGLGRLLFEQAVRHIRNAVPAGAARMELNVNRDNPALAFYEHMGMRRLRQGDFTIGNGYSMNDYIMGLDL